jgi:putative transposase
MNAQAGTAKLSHHDIEALFAEQGITVNRKVIRLWCIKFRAFYTRRLTREHRGCGDIFYTDEVFAGVPDHSNQWQTTFFWRAVHQEVAVVDLLSSLNVVGQLSWR